MNAFQHFIAMGGYGFYVWTAYGITALILGFNAFAAVARYQRLKRRLKQIKQ